MPLLKFSFMSFLRQTNTEVSWFIEVGFLDNSNSFRFFKSNRCFETSFLTSSKSSPKSLLIPTLLSLFCLIKLWKRYLKFFENANEFLVENMKQFLKIENSVTHVVAKLKKWKLINEIIVTYIQLLNELITLRMNFLRIFFKILFPPKFRFSMKILFSYSIFFQLKWIS